MSRYARAGRCPPGTRRAVRTRGVVRDGCVVVNQAAAEFQQRTGHPDHETALSQKLYNYVSNTGTHTLGSEREQARVVKNMVIELSLLVVGRVQAFVS